MKHKLIAVIGAADASAEDLKTAEELGRQIALRGWTLITGGLSGVMEAASKGASEAGGTVVGILPHADAAHANPHVGIPIATNMGHARNMVIVHSASAVIAVGGSYGTLSEIAVALKLDKPVFVLNSWDIDGTESVENAEAAIEACENLL
ncbi:MAG: TIGR00725 family protein [Pseudomonadota bacterium]